MRSLTLLLTLLAATAFGAPVGAQQGSPPRIGYVYPAGGQQGAMFTLTVGGQGLDDTAQVVVSGGGVRGRCTGVERPLKQKEFSELKESAGVLQKKRKAAGGRNGSTWTAEDERMLGELQRRLLPGPVNRQANPAISERAAFEITLEPGAEPGPRELRIRSSRGLSNPLVFIVGQLPEWGEPAARPDPLRRRDDAGARAPAPPATPVEVVLPATINGQIMPGEVDRLRFTARAGQRIVVAVAARTLIPYLADAVPGWMQATISLQDSGGRQLAFADDLAFNPDPALMFEIPQDGGYIVEIADAIFRGREDFVYRVTLGEVPYITGIHPLGGPSTGVSNVAVFGWNLPSTLARIDGAEHGAGEFRLSLRRGGILSNTVPFEVGGGIELAEAGSTVAGGPQMVALPVTISGRIETAGDTDVFGFSGHAGDECVAEVTARRLNSPLDSILRVTDAAGVQIAANDDTEDRGSGLATHHADSRVAFVLPSDGTFFVHVGDTQHRGGPEFSYRLRIGGPQPDFEVRLVPSSITVRAGGCVPVTAHVLRHDGFSGPVELVLKGAPPGLTLDGARVPAGQDSVRFTLGAVSAGESRLVPVHFEARARIGDRQVLRSVTPADDMMQAFAYRHLVPARVAVVDVQARGGRPQRAPSLKPGAVARIVTGGTGRISVGLPPMPGDRTFVFELSEPPDGIVLGGARVSRGSVELTFVCAADGPEAGRQGNLIVQAFLERPESGGKAGKDKRPDAPRRTALGALPAIPYQIVEAGG